MHIIRSFLPVNYLADIVTVQRIPHWAVVRKRNCYYSVVGFSVLKNVRIFLYYTQRKKLITKFII